MSHSTGRVPASDRRAAHGRLRPGDPRRHRGDRGRHVPRRCRRARRPHRGDGREAGGRARRSMPAGCWCCRAASTRTAISSSCGPTAARTRRVSSPAAPRAWPAAPPPSSPSPRSSRATASATRWPSIIGARRRRWWTTASTRSSPIRRTSVVRDEIPEVVASGVRSLKVFLTYEPSHLDDREFLRVLAAARRTGALVTVHCENYEAIRWRTAALMADGRSAPKYHAWSRPKVVEREATLSRDCAGRDWWISRSRCSTCRAPRWRRRSRGRRRAG